MIIVSISSCIGYHENCMYWCKECIVVRVTVNSHTNLPNGKDLTGDDLYEKLCKVFQTLAWHPDWLATGGSTEEVEILHLNMPPEHQKGTTGVHHMGSAPDVVLLYVVGGRKKMNVIQSDSDNEGQPKKGTKWMILYTSLDRSHNKDMKLYYI